MIQYISEDADKEEIERCYKKYKITAEKKAMESTNKKFEEINYYRNNNVVFDASEIRNQVFRKHSGFADEAQLDEAVEDTREKSIMYDSMTENEIHKYLNLFYAKELKLYLAEARKNAIKEVADKLGKINVYVEGGKSSKIIDRVAATEDQDTSDKEMKKIAKERIKNFFLSFDTLQSFLALEGFVGLPTGLFAGIATEGHPIFAGISLSVGVLAALFIAVHSIAGSVSFLSDMIGVKKAKKLGIIDAIKEFLQAQNNFYDYENELKNAYMNLNEQKGMAI